MSEKIQGPVEVMGGAFLIDVPVLGAGNSVEDMKRRLYATVRDIEPGSVALLRSGFSDIDESFLTAHFVEEVLGSGEVADSPAVRFGDMVLSSMFADDVAEEVAVKAFHMPKPAVNEFVINAYLNTVDNRCPALVPLGFWRNGNNQTCLLTKRESAITPYDTIFWADEAETPGVLSAHEVAKALRISSFSLGLLHGHGVVHGDAHAGNIAVDHEKVRFIDLESAKVFSDGSYEQTIDLLGVAAMLAKDIDTFVESTLKVPENRPVIAEVIEGQTDACVKSYHRGIKRAGGGENQLLAEVAPNESDITAIFQQVVTSI